MGIFKDIRVLELASVLAGPGVGQFFAELGAEVIKVENSLTGGDVTRTWKLPDEATDDRSSYFTAVNWGKKSVSLDLTSEEGRSVVYKLVKTSDFLIASYKPGDAEKLGVDYQTISSINPKIIYGLITGYGSDNPNVGYDAVIQAESGFMSMNGEPGGPSLKLPVALMDILAGHQLKEAMLLAWINFLKTGKGDKVEVSLIQAAVSSLANQATNWLVAHKIPGKHGSAHPNIAPYGDVFKTRDGRDVLLAVGSDRQFYDLCVLLAISAIATDSRFSTNQARVQNRSALHLILKDAIKLFDADIFIREINALKIPGGLIHNIQQVLNREESQPLLIRDHEFSGIRTFCAQSAISFSIPQTLLPPPHFGEHTQEILSALNR